jgi:hypothetical protein
VVVNVPAHPWLRSAADEHLGHRCRYTRSMLRRELAAAGLEPVLMSHVFSWLVVPMWAKRRSNRTDRAALGLNQQGFLFDLVAMTLTFAERLLLGRVALPVGTSVLCVAVRSGSSTRDTRAPRSARALRN